MTAIATTWANQETENVLPGVIRQVINGQNQTLVRYLYQPGAVFPEHAHSEEQITVVVSGTIAFTFAGERIIVGPGGVITIPGNTPHGAGVVGTDVVETINALSPRRGTSPIFEENGD